VCYRDGGEGSEVHSKKGTRRTGGSTIASEIAGRLGWGALGHDQRRNGNPRLFLVWSKKYRKEPGAKLTAILE